MNCRRCQKECNKVHVLCDEFLCDTCMGLFDAKKADMQKELLDWAQKFIIEKDQVPAAEEEEPEQAEFTI